MNSPQENRAIQLSIFIAFIMLFGKVGAYWITGSVAILSDAAESVIHLFATGLAGFSLWYSQKPADEDHLYGHGKIAYFSAGFEGALILIAAVTIIWIGVEKLITGVELEELALGFGITAVLCVINLWLGFHLVAVGKKHHSIVITANGHHVLTDMWTSLGVLVGVGAVHFTGLVWIDPLVGIIVGTNILITAISLIRKSYEGLMDQADPAVTEKIVQLLEKEVESEHLKGYHQLRHRRGNKDIWVELHLLFDAELTIFKAHQQATEIENKIKRLFDGIKINITSHIEPSTHLDAHPGGHTDITDPLETK